MPPQNLSRSESMFNATPYVLHSGSVFTEASFIIKRVVCDLVLVGPVVSLDKKRSFLLSSRAWHGFKEFLDEGARNQRGEVNIAHGRGSVSLPSRRKHRHM